MLSATTRRMAKKLGLISSSSANLTRSSGEVQSIILKIDAIEKKLCRIFAFLKDNEGYNRKVQFASHQEWLLPYQGDRYKLLKSLLQHIWNTQSQTKMDVVFETWNRLHENRVLFGAIQTTADLAAAVSNLVPPDARSKGTITDTQPLDRIWRDLKATPGFGDKTAALFVKSIVDTHTHPEYTHLRFLTDFSIAEDDLVRIPVDKVIIAVFERVTGKSLNFVTINDLIFDEFGYKAYHASTWDELWFWGFITQKTDENGRHVTLNEPKFWSILGAPWQDWSTIEPLAKQFMQLLESSPGEICTP